MIKAEVVFDGDEIICNGWFIVPESDIDFQCSYSVGKSGRVIKYDLSIEQAIKYCMEN